MNKDELYMQITYDLNELARFIPGKHGDKLFERIIANLNKICGYENPVEVSQTNK